MEKDRILISFEIATDVARLTGVELKKQVAAAVVEELQRSPEFAEAVRKLAIARLVEWITKEEERQ